MALGNVHITPQLVQAVRDAADIVSVASEHTRLRKGGRRMQGLCPIHKEKSPSFSVDPVQGLFYCFGCGAGGDAIKLHMLVTREEFPEAIESLATRFGVPLPSRTEKRAGWTGGERDLEGALQAAAQFFVDQLQKAPMPRQYLDDRRIPPELVERFGLGYAPDGWRNLAQALHPRIPLADLEAAGLVARSERGGEPYDRFRHRLMFPIHNASGRLVGFGGRTLGDDKAKYLNTNETERFHKGFLLYGLHQAKREIRETGRAVLCEGYFDVIGTVACGLEGAVAGMGTALTPEQSKLLSRYAGDVVVAYDGDNAGESAFRRALPLLLAEGLKVRRARFPDKHDPDSLRLAMGESAVVDAIEKAADAVSEEISRLMPTSLGRDPQKIAEASKAVQELLLPVKDYLEKVEYLNISAHRLGVEPKILLALFFGKEQAYLNLPRKMGGQEQLSEVRSLEEQVLEGLIQGEEPIPPPADLPPPEAFLDTECRNIYQAFCALYPGVGERPDGKAVMATLGHEGGAVARLAMILVQRELVPDRAGLLRPSLEKLLRRWQKQRLQELATEIREADRRGDLYRLESLLQEKTSLSQSLHRGRPSASAEGV